MKVFASLKKNKALVIYLLCMVVIRFWNFREASYFIFDVGRDAIVLREMAAGDLKLIGQTTGIPGLFYGPLWYYAGLPGFLLSGGNPYGIQAWYVLIASLALPIYWWLAHQLFTDRRWAIFAATVLGISPGGITGTNFVWNVMLATPLLAASLYFLTRKKVKSIDWVLAYVTMGLILQAEFAYAIFLISITWLLFFWKKKGFRFRHALLAVASVTATLTPLIIFELAHRFSMIKSVVANIGEDEKSVSLQYIFQNRPQQLWETTLHFFSRSDQLAYIMALIISTSCIVAVIKILFSRDVRWMRVLIIALIPYIMFMFWTGNYGYFFEYYLTPHFIPVMLISVLGMQTTYLLLHNKLRPFIAGAYIAVVAAVLTIASYRHLDGIILNPQNNAGLRAMQEAIEQLYQWSEEDQVNQSVFRVYTPNLATENYDYLMSWISKTQNLPHPSTVTSDDDEYRYMLFEPDYHNRSNRFLPWLKSSTEGFERVRSDQIGVLTIETWKKI